jgi:hypothetical protein
MKIKHYSIFNNNSATLNWEALRNDEKEAPYFLPYTVREYLAKVDATAPSATTKAIIEELEALGIKKIFSIGSGIAAQEYQLKKFSSMQLIVSDYNETVLRMKSFNVFDDAIQLDAFKDPFPVDASYAMLFPRIDTEFDDDQLAIVFQKAHAAGIRYIVFIPAELLDLKIFLAECKIWLYSILKRKPRVFCGYARSQKAFMQIWGNHYRIKKEIGGDKKFFILESIVK